LTGTSTALNNTTCNTRFLLVSITLSQTVANTDCQYLIDGAPDGTFYDAYAIFSTSSCRIDISSTTFTTYLELRRGSTGVAFAGGQGTGSPSAIGTTRSACVDDQGAPLIIVANNLNPGQAGAYTLTITIPAPAGPAMFMSGSPTVASYDSPWLSVLDTTVPKTFGRSLKPDQRR
jgi:hypothetical protein